MCLHTWGIGPTPSSAAHSLLFARSIVRPQLGTHLRGKKKREELANLMRKMQKK